MLVRAADVVKKHRTDKSQSADEKNVVGRSVAAGLQLTKKFLGENTVAPHAKKKSRGAEGAGEPAAERRHDQN